MKFLAIVSTLLVAATSAELTIYNLNKYNADLNVNMICVFNKTTASLQNLATGKFNSFLSNSTYTKYVFTCRDTDYGKDCSAEVNESVCETGYEGQFCRNYGGHDSLLSCGKCQ